MDLAGRKIGAVRAMTILPVLALAACASSQPRNAAQPTTAALGREVVLNFGESVHIENGVALEFTTLAEESRCPKNVVCVWEGNARILLTARSPGATRVLELNTNSQYANSARFESCRIELRRLEPYPGSGTQTGADLTPAAAYQATLFVDGAAQIANP